MFYSEDEVMEFLNDNDVKFACLAFCDTYGVMKNVTIMGSELHRALTTGISIDASAISGFATVDESDLFLRPVISTMTLLPWRPAKGRVVRFYCDIFYPDGTHFEMDSRRILKQAIGRAKQMGIRFNIGPECEFYLFKVDENGEPTHIPADNAGYMDVAPFDKGERVRSEICLALEAMGFLVETSRHEMGPGQNEIDFKYSDPMNSADNMLTFKSVVETVASANGLHADFSPKPLPGQPGNGLHINMSARMYQNSAADPDMKKHFLAGVLCYIREITAFLNSTEESYSRLGAGFKAPRYVTWSPENRSQLIRIPAGTGEYDRIEIRSADCMVNPYVAYALLIEAGLEGIRHKMMPSEPMNCNLYARSEEELNGIDQLPQSYGEAIRLAKNSELVKKVLPERMIEAFIVKNIQR